MVANERMTRDQMFLRLVASNERPVPSSGPAPVDLSFNRAGDSWYHEEAVAQERATREQKAR